MLFLLPSNGIMRVSREGMFEDLLSCWRRWEFFGVKVFGDKESGLEDFCLDDLNFDALSQRGFIRQRGI